MRETLSVPCVVLLGVAGPPLPPFEPPADPPVEPPLLFPPPPPEGGGVVEVVGVDVGTDPVALAQGFVDVAEALAEVLAEGAGVTLLEGAGDEADVDGASVHSAAGTANGSRSA